MLATALAFSNVTAAQEEHTWDGGGDDDLFSNPENWEGDAPPSRANLARTRVFRFGDADRYVVELDQPTSGQSPQQAVGRIDFLEIAEGAKSYTMTRQGTQEYGVYGISLGGADAADYLAINNQSGVLQTFRTPIESNAAGQEIERQIWDSGTGGLAFERTIFLRNNAKDLVLRGSDYFFGEGPTAVAMHNETGNPKSLTIDVSGTVTIDGTLKEIRPITVDSGTLLLAGYDETDPNFDLIDDRNNRASSLTLGGGSTLAFADDGNARRAAFAGTLTLTGDSTIRMGASDAGANILKFQGNTSTLGTENTLIVENWNGTPYTGGGDDQILFGSLDNFSDGDTTDQIRFRTAGGGLIDSRFVMTDGQLEVIPIPEQGAVAAGLGLLGLAGWRERGRLARLLQWLRMHTRRS